MYAAIVELLLEQQRVLSEQLEVDASERPAVGRRAVARLAEEHLGRAVPCGAHLE